MKADPPASFKSQALFSTWLYRTIKRKNTKGRLGRARAPVPLRDHLGSVSRELWQVSCSWRVSPALCRGRKQMGFSLLQNGKYLLSLPMPFTASQQITEPCRHPSAPGCSLTVTRHTIFLFKNRNPVFTMLCSQKLSAVKNVQSLLRGTASGTLFEQKVNGIFSFRDCQKHSQSSSLCAPPSSWGGWPHPFYLQACTAWGDQNPQGKGLQFDRISHVRTGLCIRRMQVKKNYKFRNYKFILSCFVCNLVHSLLERVNQTRILQWILTTRWGRYDEKLRFRKSKF